MERPLRTCVVGVITDANGKLLVGERANLNDCWQFPQGGVEPGESLIDALYRELGEEIGCSDIEVIKTGDRVIDYLFPADLQSRITKHYSGQSQTWYLARLVAGASPDLAKSDGEFQKLAWMSIPEVLAIIIDWKRPAYIEGLQLLGLISGEQN